MKGMHILFVLRNWGTQKALVVVCTFMRAWKKRESQRKANIGNPFSASVGCLPTALGPEKRKTKTKVLMDMLRKKKSKL